MPTEIAVAGGRLKLTRTKLVLIRCAERLFAQKGLDSVSLNEITTASGQRNTSALNYHFGTRQALVEAILAYRMSQIELRRREMLDALEAQGRAGDLRALVDAKVRPLAETLLPGGEEIHYVRFLTQIHASPSFGLVDLAGPGSGLVSGGTGGGEGIGALETVRARIVETLAPLPAALARKRLRLSMAFSVIALGEAERAMSRGARHADGRAFDLEDELSGIIDMQVAALAAPASC